MAKYIAFFVSSLNSGGVERAFVTLANSFVAGGHKVDFIVSQYEGDLIGQLDEKVNIIDLGCLRLRNSFSKLHKYIKTTAADCLITGPTYPNIIALVCNLMSTRKIKIIVSQHSYQDVEMKNLGLLGRIAPFLIRKTYNLAHKVVAVSEGVKTDLIENYKVLPHKVVRIYNAVIDDLFYNRAEEHIDLTLTNKMAVKPYLVAVGRLELVKNYSFMLKAFAHLKHTRPDFVCNLLVLGDGAEKDNLKRQIIELGIEDSAFLLGSLSNPFPIIKNAKMLIHSSWSEAMPLIFVEALALKVPIVAIANKGVTEILKNVKDKIVIDSHNQQDFIDAIMKTMNSAPLDSVPQLDEFRSETIRDSFLSLI